MNGKEVQKGKDICVCVYSRNEHNIVKQLQ